MVPWGVPVVDPAAPIFTCSSNPPFSSSVGALERGLSPEFGGAGWGGTAASHRAGHGRRCLGDAGFSSGAESEKVFHAKKHQSGTTQVLSSQVLV